MSRSLILLIALLPVTAYGASVEFERGSSADVAEDGSAFAGIAVHDPVLSMQNNWEDDALSLSHENVPDLMMDVHASILEGPDRFSLSPDQFILSAGEQNTLRILDSDHSAGTHIVKIRLEIEFVDSVIVGSGQIDRAVEVTVS